MPNHSPIRVFEGNANPFDPFWNFRNAKDTTSGETELEFYGPISEFSFWGDEVTPKIFKEQLYSNGNKKPVTVRLNSPGGDLIAASVISAILKDYPGRVTVSVDGLAASAAVMVALAGDRIRISPSAYMMIHNPAVGLLGMFDVDSLKGLVDELKTIKQGIIEGYQQRTNLDPEKLAKMMDDETWMTASEAVAYGFADEISTSTRANVTNFVNALSNYSNVPASLLNVETQPEPETSEAAPEPVVEPREVERLRKYLSVFAPKNK